jgi:hypothetical protein
MISQRQISEPSDESGELITYLDNATIVNACSILANPSRFDIYKLLDLDSFFEAFLFNDRVRTLVGSSFMSGFRGQGSYSARNQNRWPEEFEHDLARAIWVSREDPASAFKKLTSPRDDYDTHSLYEELIGAGILRPVVRRAGGLHYYVQNFERLDAVAKCINVDELMSLHRRVFDGGIPWGYDIPDRAFQGEWNVEKQTFERVSREIAANRAAANNVTYGEETWTSDSYPVYSFPDPSEEGRIAFEEAQRRWETNTRMGPRKWGTAETFASQTFYYVVEANLQGKSYICSSVRTPIVSNLVAQLNGRFRSSVSACLNSVGTQVAKQLEEVIDFLGDGEIRYLGSPALFLVLREARSKEDILPALFRIRSSSRISSFRSWCKDLQRAWESHDVGRIVQHIRALDATVDSFGNGDGDDLCDRTISHLGNLQLLIESNSDIGSSNPEKLEFGTFSPSLVFLKDVGATLMQPGRNRELLEDLLRHELSGADVDTANQLLKLRGSLYPPGKIRSAPKSFLVRNLEVQVGDTFNNVTNSTIINRSVVSDVLNNARMLAGLETADVIGKAAELINASGSRAAGELFEQFKDELGKPAPRKSILSATWDGIVKIVPAIASIAGAAAAMAKLLT